MRYLNGLDSRAGTRVSEQARPARVIRAGNPVAPMCRIARRRPTQAHKVSAGEHRQSGTVVQASDASSEATGPGGDGSFLIAAVGASAGGLAPTGELLRELGAKPGIAVVVIHHLDPAHESKLVEILSRTTSMPVAAASDGARIESDHVYVVLPNEELLIHQGILKVTPRLPEAGLHPRRPSRGLSRPAPQAPPAAISPTPPAVSRNPPWRSRGARRRRKHGAAAPSRRRP